MRAISLCFHDVADTTPLDLSSAVYTISREDLLAHLSAIGRGNPAVGTISQFSTWQIDVPVFLTFDDGGLGDFQYAAPALEDHRWRGHFFITTNWIDQPGYMSRVQLRELHNRGHVIGSHSRSHPERMSALALPELLSEWEESCAILRDILEVPVRTASVAGGYYSRRVAVAAALTGIRVLFTSEPTSTVDIVDGCLVLGRYSIQRCTHPEVSGSIAAGEVWHRWHQCGLWNSKKLVKTLAGESYIMLRRRLLSSRMLKT
jgi:peptidoglycan/xylan/chitin deacetylase (PgdA/CDA1 family)